jgi:hypothetical protein
MGVYIAIAEIIGHVGFEIQSTQNDEQPVANDQSEQEAKKDLVGTDGGLEKFGHVGRAG